MCTLWVFSFCKLILFWSVVHVQFYSQLLLLLRQTPRHNFHSETYGPQLEADFSRKKTVPVTCTAWFDICKLSWSKSQLSLMSDIFSTQDPGVMEGILGTISSKVKESQHSLRQFMIFRLVKSFFFFFSEVNLISSFLGGWVRTSPAIFIHHLEIVIMLCHNFMKRCTLIWNGSTRKFLIIPQKFDLKMYILDTISATNMCV